MSEKNSKMELTVTTTIKAKAKDIFDAWLSSKGHEEMTGGEAAVSSDIGGSFTAWNGYIEGRNIEIEPNKRIVQTWRTADFNEDEKDSQIEILLRENGNETELTLIHTELPDHGEQYRKGWDESYFQPMKIYFSGI